MPRKVDLRAIYLDGWYGFGSVDEAVHKITPYLEDTSTAAPKAIYFDGWDGLGACAVLRAIAQLPPPSFDKIIHLDCSRWKSRRVLQRTIAQQLKLPQTVMVFFDRQDEEDDFEGVDESFRNEIYQVGREIHHALQEYTCLLVFHNGSNSMIDLYDFDIPRPDQWVDNTRILWTFRGRLRLIQQIGQKVDDSHLYLYYPYSRYDWYFLLKEEAREIARYTCKLEVTTEIAQECCLYQLSLNSQGGNIIDYNWAIHASNYWVCDGIIQGVRFEEVWEVAAALHRQIQLQDYSPNSRLPNFGDELQAHTPPKRWTVVIKSTVEETVTVHPGTTSFFLVDQSGNDPPLSASSLPNGMFHQSNKLHTLKLCRCTFNFSSPPFYCCRSLRFLGLDSCKDQQQEQEEKQERPAIEFFQSLWVLDICYTDWEVALSPETRKQMATNIIEVHVKKGRFWHDNFAWRQLNNLRTIRIIEPTSPWETGKMDEFTDMVKLELLDLSRNSTIQVLPNMSGATSLKTLVLDGCVGLKHVGPEGLPPSLESFSLDVGDRKNHKDEAKISLISLVGCVRLTNFKLRGSLAQLEELDLSGTKVKTLELRDEVVQVPCLQRVMLLRCQQLRVILWPKGGMLQPSVLCIDTRGGEEVGRILPDFDRSKKNYCVACVAITDMRFIKSLMLYRFCWNTDTQNLNLCMFATSTYGGPSWNREKMIPASIGKMIGPNPCYCTYTDVIIDNTTFDQDCNSAPQCKPSGSCHVEIGEGISNTNMESAQSIEPILFVMNSAESLHVHDNSSITTVIPPHMMSTKKYPLGWYYLKQCCIERCPKLHTVFTTNYDRYYIFEQLENFWAVDLQMAHSIWSKGSASIGDHIRSFAKLRSIHLYSCPRLTFVLPMWWSYTLSRLETLHIVNCGDLTQLFPVEAEFLRKIATNNPNGVLEFPELKHIYLYNLSKLQQICEAKMFAPKLEKVRLRGCWGLKRLPAVGRDRRPMVDCEKDWWDKLEWDGMEVGHDPSLFQPQHSSYYKKPLPRVSLLR